MPVTIIMPGGSGNNLIPMSLFDPRFASNVTGPSSTFYGTASISNLDFIEFPTYPSGNQCFTWSSGNLNVSKCRVDWREGPRIASTDGSSVSTLIVDQCFINCVGVTTDHADGMQAFAGTGVKGNVKVTNTCFRSYDDAEALAVYGSSFIASDAFFWADTSAGTVTFNNVLIWGGSRGVTINADPGATVHVNFNNVYFVPSAPGSFSGYNYSIQSTGSSGILIVDNWTNVFSATIAGNTIIPGAALPSP